MRLSEFDYNLPSRLIADYPVAVRDQSRLLVLNRPEDSLSDKTFTDILDYLNPGDLLVLNNSKVFPARLLGQKDSGGRVEILLDHEKEPGIWEGVGKNIKPSQTISFEQSRLKATAEKRGEGVFLFNFFNLPPEDIFNEILKIGKIPLPPYIEKKRAKGKSSIQYDDKKRYQTIYAKAFGSCAAPTAGLHFTDQLLLEIKKKGVIVREVTLHVGLGTFLPIKCDEIEKHQIHKEYFSVPADLLLAIEETKATGNKVIAVGTTTTRVLETITKLSEKSGRGDSIISGWTDLYIYPGYKFTCVDSIITNFHLPKSSLLVLVSAFAGRERILAAYDHAIDNDYRFYSYGDAMLIV